MELVNWHIRRFAKSILHGDKAHKDWLIEAAERFIAGKKPPKPPGSRGCEALRSAGCLHAVGRPPQGERVLVKGC